MNVETVKESETSATVEAPARKASPLSRLRSWLALLCMSVAFLLLGGSAAANAAIDPSYDPTGGQVSDSFGNNTNFVTHTLGPAFIILALAGVGFFVGVRWVKKALRSA